MRALESLNKEHKLLYLLLRSFEKQMEEAQEFGRLNVDTAKDILGVIQDFATGVHMVKEERHLVPKLLAAGVPRSYGPLLLMGEEHARIHDDLSLIYALFEELYDGNIQHKHRFVEMVPPAINHIRLHMYREENSIYALAETILTEEDWAELEAAFDHADRVHGDCNAGVMEAKILDIAGRFDLALNNGTIVAKSAADKLARSGAFVVKRYQPS